MILQLSFLLAIRRVSSYIDTEESSLTMDFLNRLIINCLALLAAIASSIECLDESNEPICQKLPNGSPWQVTNGFGVKDNYQPYILNENQYDPKGINYTVFNNKPSKNCTFIFEDGRLIDNFYAYQVSDNKIVLFLESGFPEDYKIMSLDINNCTKRSMNQILEKNLDRWGSLYYIYNAQGIDVIVEKENQTTQKIRYDFNGNQIGSTEPFFKNNNWMDPRALNPFSSSSNVIVDYTEDGRNFVDLLTTNGQLIKHLVTSKDHFNGILVKHVSDSMFACCWSYQNEGFIYCAQFDQNGNRTYFGYTKYHDVFHISVRNLKDGGVIVFSYTTNHVRAIEMRPDNIYEHLYPLNRAFWYKHVVASFNEVERQFTIRTKTDYSQHYLCWRTWDFPSKIQQDGQSDEQLPL